MWVSELLMFVVCVCGKMGYCGVGVLLRGCVGVNGLERDVRFDDDSVVLMDLGMELCVEDDDDDLFIV